MKTEYSLLIQGPYHYNAIKNIKKNQNLVAQIVVGTWKQDWGSWEPQIADLDIKLGVGFGDEILVDPGTISQLQVATTVSALEICQAEFVIKCRSDEYFNLDAAILKHQKQKNKTLFGNFTERPFSLHKFFVSDHLIIAPRNVLTSAFEDLAANKRQQYSSETVPFESHLGYALFTSGLRLSAESPPPPPSTNPPYAQLRWSDFRLHFELVDLQTLKPFEVGAQRAQVTKIHDLKKLGKICNSKGWPIDFVYRPNMLSLAPKTKPIEIALKYWRYFMRVKFNPVFNRIKKYLVA